MLQSASPTTWLRSVVTAIEVTPIGDFQVDGTGATTPRCPTRQTVPMADRALEGTVEAAHSHRLMMLLDVVYNHFGPEGAHVHAIAPETFTIVTRHRGARQSISTG
jgi:hypothetical protein